LDARDDFYAQMKKSETGMPSWMEDDNTLWDNLEQTIADNCLDMIDTGDIIPDIHISTIIGKSQLQMQAKMVSIRRTLTDAGWIICNATVLPPGLQLQPKPVIVKKSPAQWNNMVVLAHGYILEERARFMPQTIIQGKTVQPVNFVPNEVKIVNKFHLEKRCQPSKWQKIIDSIAKDFKLNKEQEYQCVLPTSLSQVGVFLVCLVINSWHRIHNQTLSATHSITSNTRMLVLGACCNTNSELYLVTGMTLGCGAKFWAPPVCVFSSQGPINMNLTGKRNR
jgi:hypothetical protein